MERERERERERGREGGRREGRKGRGGKEFFLVVLSAVVRSSEEWLTDCPPIDLHEGPFSPSSGDRCLERRSNPTRKLDS